MEAAKEPGKLVKFFNKLTEEIVPEPTEEELAAEKEAKAAKKQENQTKKEEEKLAKEEAKKAKAEEKAAAARVKQEAAAQKKKKNLPRKRRRKQNLRRRDLKNVYRPKRLLPLLLLGFLWAARLFCRRTFSQRRDFYRQPETHIMMGIIRRCMRQPTGWSLMTVKTTV